MRRLSHCLLAGTAAALLAACSDRAPLAPDAAAPPPDGHAQRYTCEAHAREGTLTCTRPAVNPRIRTELLGGQGQYVQVITGNVSFDPVTLVLSADLSVKNLRPYPLGTSDGATPDSGGVKLLIASGPVVTSGWGTVTLANPDGTGIFTGTAQPFIKYPGLLAPDATTAPRTWQFQCGPDVDHFTFTLLVEAATPPRLVIDEIMAHPTTASEAAGEWFEVYNASNEAVDLNGFTIASGGDAGHTISGTLMVPGNGYVVLGASRDTSANGGTPVSYVYSGIDLANDTSDWLALRSPTGGTVDSVAWSDGSPDATPPPTGASVVLSRLLADNSAISAQGSPWQVSRTGYGAGQLGSPGAAALVVLQAVKVAAGDNHSCALDIDGKAWCWGYNLHGESGIGSTAHPVSPARQVAQPFGLAFGDITAGMNDGCALDGGGAAWCWGMQMPLEGAVATVLQPTAVPTPGETFTRLGEGSCAIDGAGQIWCWGGDKGIATVQPQPPVAFASFDGYAATCALGDEGRAYCRGTDRVLGIGTTPAVATTFVGVHQPEGVTFTSLSSWTGSVSARAYGRACGVSQIGQLFCWGGPPSSGPTVPTALNQPPTVRFAQVSVSQNNACAVDNVGQAWCWGANQNGEVGDGTRTPRTDPTLVSAPAGVAFGAVSSGGSHTCALAQESGDVYCWGGNVFGELGDGSTGLFRATPGPVLRLQSR